MVAFFRYSPVDILSVNLPPSTLDFSCRSPQGWLKSVAIEVFYFIKLVETLLILCIPHINSRIKNHVIFFVFVSLDIWQNGSAAYRSI